MASLLCLLLSQPARAQTVAATSEDPASPPATPAKEDPPAPPFVAAPIPEARDTSTARASFFYFDQDYGSESQFGPLSVLFNIGFVVTGRLTDDPRLGEIGFGSGASTVFEALLHQKKGMKESGGIGTFLKEEFIPFAGSSGAWAPNYILHLTGEAMLYRKLEEYYRARGLSGEFLPKALGISTVVAAQLLNEIVETEMPWAYPGDHIADLYFNIAGLVAFSFDEVAGLLSNESVRLYFWPGQPVVDVRDGALFNHGESYLLRTTLGEWTTWKLALGFGLPTSGIGVSIPLSRADFLTVATGTDAPVPLVGSYPSQAESVDTDPVDEAVLDRLTGSLNVFWDREGSLMASGALSVYPDFNLSLNAYPGIVDMGPIDLGAYLVLSQLGASTIGLTLSYAPLVPGTRL